MQARNLVCAASLLLTVPAAAQRDWRGFRGPGRDGIARDAKPPLEWSDSNNMVWKVEMPGPGSASPIVVGNRIYVACYSGYGNYLDDGGDRKKLEHHLVCLDRRTGKKLWQRSVADPLAEDPPRVQITEHGFASPTPISDGTTVYVYFGHAGLFAYSLDGERKWQRELGTVPEDAPKATNQVVRNGKPLSLRWGAAASPLLYEGLVIVNCSEESNSIRALDKDTGKLVWKHESSNLEGCATSPVIVGEGDNRVLVIVLAGETWGLAPNTGKLLWKVETGTRGGMVPTPVADRSLVYVFGGMGKSHAVRFAGHDSDSESLEDKSSRVSWKSENLGIPSPVLHDGKLFLVNSSGFGVYMDAKDGKVIFKERLAGRTGGIYASPVLADDKLYVVTKKRGTFVYSADGKFKLLARNELEDETRFNASPAMVGNQVFLRSDKYLYCFSQAS